MHSAPSVTFPVGRSRFPLAWVLLPWGLAALAIALWAVQTQADAAAMAASAAGWLACGGAAWWGWRQQARGLLTWDGEAWCWQAVDASGVPSGKQMGEPHCAMDLQRYLWVRWTDAQGVRVQWMWLSAGDDAAAWPALRRALFARRRASASAGEP